MKKIQTIILPLFLLIVSFALYQCTNTNVDCEECKEDEGLLTVQKLPTVLENFQIAGLNIPDGTIAEYITPRKVEFTYPIGYKFVSKSVSSDYAMRGQSTYECTCTGSGCNVIAFPSTEEGEWEVGCSSCNSSCVGEWKNDDLQFNQNSGFINFEAGISFIKNESTSIACPDGPNANSIFEIHELNHELDLFMENNELSLWNGESDDFVLIPIQAFGLPVVLKFNNDKSILSKKDNSNQEKFKIYSSSNPPTCGCNSGSSGCDYEAIKNKPCGICPEIVVGHQCTSGDCTSCAMTLPDVN